jgi:translation initiation factor IF-3
MLCRGRVNFFCLAEVKGTIERELRVNERIRAREVRVIDENGAQLGIMPVPEALRIARERNLDLIEVAPNSQPPVCRVMDYGKHKYEEAKRDREARKKTKTSEVRLLRLKPQISRHDLDVKIRKLRELLGDGDKVRVTLRFRGREMARPEMGAKLLQGIANELADAAIIEGTIRQENRMMLMMLAPKPGAKPVKDAPKEKARPEAAPAPKAVAPAAPLETATVTVGQPEKEKVVSHANETQEHQVIGQPLQQSADAEDSGETG